jgi:L-asparaginase/Glu-tRNA(Gln) amidotransferase subunit D
MRLTTTFLRSNVASLGVVCVFSSTAVARAQTEISRELPLVWVLSTGGTIAGQGASSTTLTEYKPGLLGVFLRTERKERSTAESEPLGR